MADHPPEDATKSEVVERVVVDLGFGKGEPDVYLARGKEWIGSSAVSRRDMLSHFRLDASLKAMGEAILPDGCKHLLKGLGLSNSHADLTTEYGTNLSLLTVVEEQAFGRPIEPLPDHMVQTGFQFPTTTPINGAKLHKVNGSTTKPGFVHPPPSNDDKASSVSASEKLKKEEKKKEKKRKREREEAESLKSILEPLVRELKAMTWKGWADAKGKPSNPFIVKITRENCKSLMVPNYFDYIQVPMDLTRIGEKVAKTEYTKLDQIEADIALLVANAKRYNREGEPVHQMTIEFQKAFDDKMKLTYRPIYDELAAERKKQKKEKKKKKDKKKDK